MRITAVVTDAKGELVKGLRARDFDLRADGVPQQIESAQLTVVPPDSPRVFALLLDEFHVDAASTNAVRDALMRFVDTALRSADQVVVLKPLDPLTTIQPTADRAQLRRSIESFEGRKGDYTPRTLFEKKYMPQAPAAVAVGRAQIVTSALRAMAAWLSEMPEVRGVIVLVSDGFSRTRMPRESPADLQAAIRPANGASTCIYVLSPSAPLGTGPSASVETDDRESEQIVTAARMLAAQTGGEFTTGITSLYEALARVSRDLDTHYVLTYRPSHGNDGRFHALQLEVKRRSAVVRARGGYLAPMSAQMRAARAAADGRGSAPRALRRSPLIAAWTGFTRNADGTARVVVTWEPKRIAATLRRPAAEAILLTASTPDGEVIYQSRVGPVGAAHRSDARESAAFDAPSGRLLIDINIVDAKGAVLDFDARDLEVPDLQKRGVILLPVSVLRARSAREFRAASANPNAPPSASREFRRTDRLLVRVPAYDSGSATPVTATLLNGWRQPMRTLTAMPEVVGEGVTQFDVPLAPLAPGEYVIRISAPGAAEHVMFRVTS